jgi:Protein of unknown function (DUF1488)
MALTQGIIIGYNNDRMTFEFTMKMPNGRIVACEISSVAMDQMDGVRGIPPSGREAQFIRLRGSIEKIAADVIKIESAPPPLYSKIRSYLRIANTSLRRMV